MKLSGIAAAALLGLGLAAATIPAAARASDQTDLLRRATETAENMNRDPAFEGARHMLRHARAVLIVPTLVKGGFIFGGEGGNGVLLARTRRGWSNPAFYSFGGASFGFQIGLEQAEIVLLIMSDRALRAVEQEQFKFGAGAGLTVVTLSGGAEGATAPNLTGDIIVWTSATGAYGGLTLNGSIIKPREEWNEDFYNRDVRPSEILAGRVRNPQANALRDEISSVW
ncbi:MAG: lipid-binding SYLF domain-containing protein [Alphaproteobacteria bacterium]|nr:lipid-binding SYLF domain-containing protein [Alphaproteobacteria bacterium]